MESSNVAERETELEVDFKPEMPIGPEGSVGSALYTGEQQKYLENLYGIDIPPNTVLVCRAMGTVETPTGFRSCSILAPGQEIPYYETGFLYALKESDIPWVAEKDLGIPLNTKNAPAMPDGAKNLREYLSSRIVAEAKTGKNESLAPEMWSETVVNLENRVPIAIFDFFKVPPLPGIRMRLLSPQKATFVFLDRMGILGSIERWRLRANELKIPFITELKSSELMDKMRRRRAERNRQNGLGDEEG